MGQDISQQQWSFLKSIAKLDSRDGVEIGDLELEMGCFTPKVIQTLSDQKRIGELRDPINDWIAKFVECGFIEDHGGHLHTTKLGRDIVKRVR